MKAVCGLVLLASTTLLACAAAPTQPSEGNDDSEVTAPPKPAASSTGTPVPTTPAPVVTTLPAPATTTPAPVVGACPIDVPAAGQLSIAADASDLQIVNGRLYFRTGTALVQVALNGASAFQLASGDSFGTRYFVDGTSITSVSDDGTCLNSTKTLTDVSGIPTSQGSGLRFCGGGDGMAATALRIFGADTERYFLIDSTNPSAISLASVNQGTRQMLSIASTPVPITDPQVRNGFLFWVEGGRNVMRAESWRQLPVASLVASVDGCRLAVGLTTTFCSTPTAVVGFDSIGTARTIFNLTQSRSTAPLGAAIADGDTLFVASAAPSADGMQNVLREVKGFPATERMLACGRGTITSMAFDATHVAFAEAGRGVFIVNR